MRLASEALRNGAIGQVQELLKAHESDRGAEALHGFEWRYLWHEADQSSLVITQFQGLSDWMSSVFTEGKLYNVIEGTDQILAWDMATWAPLPLRLPPHEASVRWWWRPRQQAALAANNKERTLSIYRLPNFEKLSVTQLRGEASQAALSHDLRTLAVAFEDGHVYRILVLDLAEKSHRLVCGEYRTKVTLLDFSPDDDVLLAACEDGEVGLWSVTDGKALPSPPREVSTTVQDWRLPYQTPPFFGPDSTRLYLTRGRELRALEAWDWNTGKSVSLYPTGGFEPAGAPDHGIPVSTRLRFRRRDPRLNGQHQECACSATFPLQSIWCRSCLFVGLGFVKPFEQVQRRDSSL
jgi:WD40 repeat protein